MKVIYCPYMNPAMGYRFILTVYDKAVNERMLCLNFNAPSMVVAGDMFVRWREKFLEINGFEDDNFIYEIYNISLGKRRVIK